MNITKRKRKDGSVAYRVRIQNSDGSTFSSCTFDSKKDAEIWGGEQERLIETHGADGLRAAKITTLDEVLVWYSKTITPMKKGAKDELYMINGVLRKSEIAKMNMADIGSKHIYEYIDDRMNGVVTGRKVVAETVNRDLNLLSNVFNEAVTRKGLKLFENPVQQTKRPAKTWSATKRKRRLITNEEAKKVIEYLEENEYETCDLASLFKVALYTGMRLSTVCSIRYEQIDFENCCVWTTEEQQKHGDDEQIPLLPIAQGVFRKLFEKKYNDTDVLFDVISPNAVSVKMGRVLRKLEMPKEVVFHSTRHSFSTMMFDVLGDALAVRQFTGHKTNKAFEGYVGKDTKKMVEKAAALLMK